MALCCENYCNIILVMLITLDLAINLHHHHHHTQIPETKLSYYSMCQQYRYFIVLCFFKSLQLLVEAKDYSEKLVSSLVRCNATQNYFI